MSSNQPQDFKGISQCISSFNSSVCLAKTIEFSLSTIMFITGLVLLYNYIRVFGLFKGKVYINFILIFMQLYLLSNMCYCLWNNIYEFYSIQTYFNNLYFLVIVTYTTKSYLVKKTPREKLQNSRTSIISHDTKSEKGQNNYKVNKKSYFKSIKFYKLLYKSMAIIFFILFTMIFITSLVGDIQNNNILDDQINSQDGNQFLSFLKNSCQQFWYLCIQLIYIILSLIVLIVLVKNYKYQQQRIKKLALITATIHQRPSPFEVRSTVSKNSYTPTLRIPSNSKYNNPLTKLSFWIGFNILGQIVNLVESGLLLNADYQNNCQIVSNPTENSIVKLIFVVFSVYIQYISTIWFFYDSLNKKIKTYDDKNQKLLIQSHDYSEQIKIGHIQMNGQFGKTNSSGED